MNKRTALGSFALIAVLSTALAACSSSSKKDTGGTGGEGSSSRSSAPAQTFTGAPINVGSSGPITGSQTNYPLMHDTADAAVSAINAAGGIKTADGKTHELKLTYCNNQGDPSVTVQCATQLIDKKVVAAVGSFDQNSDKSDPLLTKAKIVNFGNNALTTWDLAGSDSYPVLGPSAFTYAGMGEALAATGVKVVRPAGLAETKAALTPLFNTLKVALEAKGAKLLAPVWFPAATTDYAPVAAEMAKGNPQTIVCVCGEAFLPPVAQALKQSSSTAPVVTNVIGGLTQKDIDSTGGANSVFNNAVSVNLFSPPTQPEWKPFRDAIDKYQPGAKAAYTDWSSAYENSWVAFNAFATIASKINGPVTAASFKTALDSTSDLDTGGLTPKIDFTKPFACGPFSRAFNTTYYGPVVVKNGKIVPGSGAGLKDAGTLVKDGFGAASCGLTQKQLGVS